MKKPLFALCALLLATLSGVQAEAAATYQYSAEISAPVQRQVTASGINWNCQGSRCTTSGPWATPTVGACHALAQQVGPVRSYGHKGGMLTPGELQQCNAGVATNQMTPFARGSQPVSPPPVTPPMGTPPTPPGTPSNVGPGLKRLVTADDFAPLTPPLPAAPHRVAVAPLTPSTKAPGTPPITDPTQKPVTVNTDTFMRAPQMVAPPPSTPPTKAPGTPPSVAPGQGPVVINADTLRYAGPGPGRGPVVINADTLRYAGPGPGRGPVVINADTLRYVGRGPVVININADTLQYSGTTP